MEPNIEIPLDEDGYLDRECPSCERRFRWHDGPVGDTPAEVPQVEEYHCPYCGQQAAADQWWTSEQVETLQQTALAAVIPEITRELGDSLKGLNSTGFVTAEVHADLVSPPPPLFVDDAPTVTVTSPCHPYEPVKLLGEWVLPLHCLVCGAPYRVA
jgi:predicted nucleic acid-binding Zn ribbon protein